MLYSLLSAKMSTQPRNHLSSNGEKASGEDEEGASDDEGDELVIDEAASEEEGTTGGVSLRLLNSLQVPSGSHNNSN